MRALALAALMALAVLAARASALYVQVDVPEAGWYLISVNSSSPLVPYDYENGTLLPYVAVGWLGNNWTLVVYLPEGSHVIELRNETPSLYGGGAENYMRIIDKASGVRHGCSSTGYFDGSPTRFYSDSLGILQFGSAGRYDWIGILASYDGMFVRVNGVSGSLFYFEMQYRQGSRVRWSNYLWAPRDSYHVLIGRPDGFHWLVNEPDFDKRAEYVFSAPEASGINRFANAGYSWFRRGIFIEHIREPSSVSVSEAPPGAGGGTGSNETIGWEFKLGYPCGDPRKPTVTVAALPPIFPAGQIGGAQGEHIELHAYWVTDLGLPWLLENGTLVRDTNRSLSDYQCVRLWIGWSTVPVANITEAELYGELVVPITESSFTGYRRGWPSFPIDAQLPEEISGTAYFVAANVFETPYWRVIVWTNITTSIEQGSRGGFIGRLLAALLEPVKRALASAVHAVAGVLPEPVREALSALWSLAASVMRVIGSFLSQLPGYVSEYSRLLVALAPLIVLSVALEPEAFIKFITAIINIMSKIVNALKP